MSRRNSVCIGNANGSGLICLKFVASEVAPREIGRRTSMQKWHGEKIRWRQNRRCVANADGFDFLFGAFFKFFEKWAP